jgi:CIC family chloride channel protein
MTSVFMALEVSGNYSIIVPVLVANTFAYVISRSLQPTPIFDLLTRQDGLNLPSMEEQREERILRVEDAMQPVPHIVLDSVETVSQVNQKIQTAESDFFLIRMSPTGWGSITQERLARFAVEGKQEMTLGSLCEDRLPYLYPDLPLEMALRYVHTAQLIPVVSRADFCKLEGVISRDAALSRYTIPGPEDVPFA